MFAKRDLKHIFLLVSLLIGLLVEVYNHFDVRIARPSDTAACVEWCLDHWRISAKGCGKYSKQQKHVSRKKPKRKHLLDCQLRCTRVTLFLLSSSRRLRPTDGFAVCWVRCRELEELLEKTRGQFPWMFMSLCSDVEKLPRFSRFRPSF